MSLAAHARRGIGGLVLVLSAVLAAGGLAAPASAAPAPVVFGTAAASPKVQSVPCPATVKLATALKVKAPATLKYRWLFSDGGKSVVKTYRVGGKGIKSIRLTTTLKVADSLRGWGAVGLVAPVKKVSRKAHFAVTCTTGGTGTPDPMTAVGYGQWTAPPATGQPQQDNPPATDPNPVRGITLEATPKSYAGRCPTKIALKAGFTFAVAPKPGATVTYRLIGSDGKDSDWKSLTLPAGASTSHQADLGQIEVAKTGWQQLEVAQPDQIKSNQAHFALVCGDPEVSVSKAVAHPGETVTVSAKFVGADVKSIASKAFVPETHAVPAGKKEYSFEAKVSTQLGEHEVKALFADNDSATTKIKVVEDPNPVKGVKLALDPAAYEGRCPAPVKVTATFDLGTYPAAPLTIAYRAVGTEAWKTISVPAGHNGSHTAELEPLRFAESKKGAYQIELKQADGAKSNAVAYDIACGEHSIVLSKASGHPGEEVTVTVKGFGSDVKTVVSKAFTPETHQAPAGKREYTFKATVSAVIGEHPVKATFANGDDAGTGFTVEAVKNPVAQVAVVVDPTGYRGECPVTLKVRATFKGIPSYVTSIQYRRVGAGAWQTLTLPAGHGGTHVADLPSLTFTSSDAGKVRLEVNQPDGLKSNEAGYEVVCGKAGITLDKTTAHPGDKVEVRVDGFHSDVRTISSEAFVPKDHTVSGTKRVYEFDATVGDKLGTFTVTAKLADGSSVTASLKVEAAPIKVTGLKIEFKDDDVRARCPVSLPIYALFSGLPRGSQTLEYRIVGTATWQSVTVTGGHDGKDLVWLEPLQVTASGKGSIQIEIKGTSVRSDQESYEVTCLERSITLSKSSAMPGEKIEVEVNGVDSKVDKVVSQALDPSPKDPTWEEYRYSYNAEVKEIAPGTYPVTAYLRDGTTLVAQLTVLSPVHVKGVSLSVAPDLPSNGKVTCGTTFQFKATFDLTGAPAGAYTIRYRFPENHAVREIAVPANHGTSFTAVVHSITIQRNEGYNTQLELVVDQPRPVSDRFHFKARCD
ncbi:hypothetical protein [Nonomuraea sp. NPDC050310]|uniref:hypothetical protein n=1 Tax=Nonomuraea sp. NPDC050310 TaxID=3154935 RepID=UPI0033D44A30